MTGNRPLVILSNRLPVTIRREHGEILFTSSVGGLATALRRVHDNGGGIWIGSPGETGSLTTEQMAEAHAGLKKRGLQAVELPAAVSHRFMDEVCNAVLWPLFHCLTDRIPKTIGGWKSYEQANQAFAEAAVDNSPPDSLFWIHDYHLLLVPALIRRKRPGARIGFFLHIPFPPPEIFRILPARREILSGLAAADVVGFQTPTDAMSFQRALEQEKIASAPGPIIRDYPISIDAAHFSSLASSPQAVEETRRIRDRHPGTILLGVDRLDYTKGIPRRLLAYEYFLSRNPALRTAASLIQVAVPSRHTVDEYAAFRRDVDELTGRINGVHATPEHIPLHYMHRSFPEPRVAAMYAAADIMLVTPLRDGMNLVAKEYCACRNQEDGVLILSEFAGAANELKEAILVNPYDIKGVARAIEEAMAMPPIEQRRRMKALRARIFTHDVHAWAEQFLGDLLHG